MAHPFFDTLRYPWHRPEARLLHEALTDGIRSPQVIDTIYRECADGLLPLSLGSSHYGIWKEALENLTSSGALPKLGEIVLGMNAFKNNPIMQNVFQGIVNAQAAAEVRIISDDVLVLDRVRLREHLALLESNATPVKVLLVRGGPRSGKSHGRYLFERAALDQGALPVYLCDGIVATVDEVVMLLFSALGASEKIPPRLTSEDAWYRAVCFKLQEVASSQSQPLWIAVDDLGLAEDGAPLLDTEIRKFCDQFALNMLNPAFRQWFRLMLIHYPDGPVPTKWKRDFWTEDRTSDADVQQKDVEEILRTWAVAHDQTIIEGELTARAADVVAKAETPAAPGEEELPRLQRIHDSLAETLRNLVRR